LIAGANVSAFFLSASVFEKIIFYFFTPPDFALLYCPISKNEAFGFPNAGANIVALFN